MDRVRLSFTGVRGRLGGSGCCRAHAIDPCNHINSLPNDVYLCGLPNKTIKQNYVHLSALFMKKKTFL